MVEAQDHRMSEAEIARLAVHFEGVMPGYDRSESGMRKLASDLDLTPDETAEWPRSRDGAVQGVVCAATVDGAERPWTVLQDHHGVRVALSRITGGARTHAEEFRRVAAAVQGILRTPDHFGTYANGRIGCGEAWGTPYLRWRGKYATVELRAGASGPELVSDFTDLWEEDYRDDMARNPTGFIGTFSGDVLLDVPAARASDLGEFTEALAALFSRLPAETLALGVSLTLGLFGTVTREDGTDTSPLMFDIRSGERLHLGYCAPGGVAEAGSGERVAALGWEPTNPETLRGGPELEYFDAPWYFDGGGPGETRAHDAAALIVRTAKAAGVRRVGDLALGGEAEQQGRAYYRFPGLRLKTV
ncbi:hypothetical protein [Glycomyces harbinensis]|uniref:Uncharacterized protein n=1 Tax=Glycomyces harbinensis TaxID=58114 RepID=A0A1G7BZS3_9ACTN|nr:hypothetical protein [Glycomyces harbinensis]SDE32040.1 hypothetical protein SAMN05216270_11845 [Glycomyces harbinensis]